MRKIISLFMLILFATTNISIAEEVEQGDYVELDEGEEAPYSGYLFDHDGIAGLITKHDKEKEQIVLNKDTEYKKLKISLEAELAKKQTELDINKKLSDDMLKLNKEELELTQAKLERISWLGPTMFVAGLVAGTLLTVSVLKIAVETVK